MRARSENFTYTQRSVISKSESKHYKYSNSFYGHMFLEDICANFSIRFSDFAKPRNFFTTSPNDSNLGTYFESSDHEFSNVLSRSMYNLLLNGVSYVEIVLGFDDEELRNISFVPLNITKHTKKKGEIKFFATGAYNEKPVDWVISNDFLIKLDLNDLGMRRNHFRKILKGLSDKGLPDFDWIAKSGNSLDNYINRQTLHSMKLVGDTYWDLRKSDNEYTNDVHLLYRRVMSDLFKFKFLEYMLARYNKTLKTLGAKYGFEGEIAHTVDISGHKAKLTQLLSGEISCDDMCGYLFRHNAQ